jgi:lipopolysaccharide transport system permease protein
LSGIFFSGDIVPEKLRIWFYLNPMAALLESWRNVLMGEGWPMWGHMAGISIASCLLIVIGAKFMRRFDYSYPKLMV